MWSGENVASQLIDLSLEGRLLFVPLSISTVVVPFTDGLLVATSGVGVSSAALISNRYLVEVLSLSPGGVSAPCLNMNSSSKSLFDEISKTVLNRSHTDLLVVRDIVDNIYRLTFP